VDAAHPDRIPSAPGDAPIILLIGRPGIGKTTVIQHIVDALTDRIGSSHIHG
jgi:ABC-type branched-subunit amino acid transport system ATPase component